MTAYDDRMTVSSALTATGAVDRDAVERHARQLRREALAALMAATLVRARAAYVVLSARLRRASRRGRVQRC